MTFLRGAVLRLLPLLLAGCAAAAAPEPGVIVDDFESGRARWRDAGSGAKRTEVDLRAGAARITFGGGATGWTDLTWPVDRWPEGATAIAVRVRAPRACRVFLKVNLGPEHDDLEMWGRTLELTAEWREHVVPVAQLTHYIWGHRRSAGPDASRIVGIGFAESDFPVTFEVDFIAIRR